MFELRLEDYIFRGYHFVVELTFKLEINSATGTFDFTNFYQRFSCYLNVDLSSSFVIPCDPFILWNILFESCFYFFFQNWVNRVLFYKNYLCQIFIIIICIISKSSNNLIKYVFLFCIKVCTSDAMSMISKLINAKTSESTRMNFVSIMGMVGKHICTSEKAEDVLKVYHQV